MLKNAIVLLAVSVLFTGGAILNMWMLLTAVIVACLLVAITGMTAFMATAYVLAGLTLIGFSRGVTGWVRYGDPATI